MRRRIVIIFILAMMFMGTSYSSATNTQNLSWGLSPGDRIDYTLSVDAEESAAVSWDNGVYNLYCIVNELKEIPTTVTSIMDITLSQSYVTFYFTNGTTFPTSLIWLAVPIGNWTLLTSLLTSTAPTSGQITYIDSATEWGYDYIADYGNVVQTTIFRVLKEDGALNRYEVRSDDDNPAEDAVVIISRPGLLNLPIDSSLLLPIAIGIGVILIVLVIVVMKKR